MSEGGTKVLVVDDEENIADGYAAALDRDYDVTAVYSGEEALAELDDDYGVVLLDRRMPDQSGEEVLADIRERGYDCRVAMVTAVTPDFDIVEMGFDDYLVKPVDVDELERLVARLEVLSRQSEQVREYIAESVKQASLETTKSDVELADESDYRALRDRVTELSTELGDISARMTDEEFELVLETIVRNIDAAGGDSAGT